MAKRLGRGTFSRQIERAFAGMAVPLKAISIAF
jgi:hypothetical protein